MGDAQEIEKNIKGRGVCDDLTQVLELMHQVMRDEPEIDIDY